MDRIVVAGAGLAGLAAAQELRRNGFTGEVVMVGAEPHLPYRRPPLSKDFLLADHAPAPALGGVDDLAATWLLGHAASGLDLGGRRVLRGDQPPIPFDGLVIATGVRPRGPSPATMTVRTLDDARALRARLTRRPQVVVIGAGFLGCELAATARALDLPVALVDRAPQPLWRALGAEVGAAVADLHRTHGVVLRLGRQVEAVAAGRVRLDDGTVLPADLVITALGSTPATRWLLGSGLACADGVVVDADGVAAPGVVAAGDVARRPQPLLGGKAGRVEHYTNAVEEGARAARALLGHPPGPTPVPSFWSHLHGRRLQAVGHTGAAYDTRVVRHEPDGRFLAEYHLSGRVVGAATIGFARDLVSYRHQLVR